MKSDPFFIRSLKQESRNMWAHLKVKPKLKSKILKELDREGISIIPSFYNLDQVKKLKSDTLEILSRTDLNIFEDEVSSDFRAFGADFFSDSIKQFCYDKTLKEILETYEGHQFGLVFTMANHLIPKKGNRGSGGGWHRDSPTRKQTKAITYLTDVKNTNGPFQYIKGTHKPLDALKHRILGSFDRNQKRISEEEVESILKNSKYSITEVDAKAGDLILVDTRGIHRGKPIINGERIALTNYYWKNKKPLDHFKQLALHPEVFG